MCFDGPNEVEYMGPSNHMSFLCTPVDPKTSCDLMDPENQQESIKPHEVLGTPKHMRF